MWPLLLLEFSQRCPNLFANLTSSLSGKTIPGGTHNAQPWHLFKRKCKRQNGADVIYPSTAELCFRWPIWSRWLPLIFLFFVFFFFFVFFPLRQNHWIEPYRSCMSVCLSVIWSRLLAKMIHPTHKLAHLTFLHSHTNWLNNAHLPAVYLSGPTTPFT